MTKRRTKRSTRLFVVTNCAKCPNCEQERTPRAGYAHDYYCKATGKMIAGYIEWPSEMPKDGEFPDWCPLAER